MTETTVAEFPLPSGKFIAWRRMTWLDRALCRPVGSGPEAFDMMAMKLAARCATLDGAALTPEQWAELDCADGDAVGSYVVDTITGPVKS